MFCNIFSQLYGNALLRKFAVRDSDGRNGTPGWPSEARMGRTGLRASRQKLGWAERDSGLTVRSSDGRNGTPGWPSEARMDGTGLRADRQKLGWAERDFGLTVRSSDGRNGTPGWPSEARMGGTEDIAKK